MEKMVDRIIDWCIASLLVALSLGIWALIATTVWMALTKPCEAATRKDPTPPLQLLMTHKSYPEPKALRDCALSYLRQIEGLTDMKGKIKPYDLMLPVLEDWRDSNTYMGQVKTHVRKYGNKHFNRHSFALKHVMSIQYKGKYLAGKSQLGGIRRRGASRTSFSMVTPIEGPHYLYRDCALIVHEVAHTLCANHRPKDSNCIMSTEYPPSTWDTPRVWCEETVREIARCV